MYSSNLYKILHILFSITFFLKFYSGVTTCYAAETTKTKIFIIQRRFLFLQN